MDSDKIMLFTTTLMTGVWARWRSIVLLVMTVVLCCFEVRHVPYKLRFALNNPQIHIAGLPLPERRLALSGAENAAQFMDGRDYLAGTGVNGYSVCANVGRTGLLLNYVLQYRLVSFRRSP